MMTHRLSSLALAAVLGVSALVASSDASALPGAAPSCWTPVDGFPVCVGISQAGGAGGGSEFLGAFRNSAGGWTEVYSDKQGVWWMDHNKDGSVTIGQEDIDTGSAHKKKSSKPVENVPGTFKGSSRPTGTGTALPAIKPNLTMLKASALQKTGFFSSVTPSTAGVLTDGPPGSRKVTLKLEGGGKCSALMLITRDGKLVSSTGITDMSFPQQREIELPNEAGTYRIDVKGYNGCMASKASTQVTVTQTMVMTGIISTGDR